jgi:hypothetical protein
MKPSGQRAANRYLTQAASSGKRCWNSIKERGKSIIDVARADYVRDPFYNELVPPATTFCAPGRRGISLPDHLLGCVSENTDHGIDILLDHRPGCGSITDQRPYADVFASYNVATNAVTPQMLAQVRCGYEKTERTVWLSGWRLGDRDAAGCRQYFKDGRIRVEIVTQRKTEPRNPEIWIDLSASLTTTASRYEHDMSVFRKIVRTVRIAPDGPLE